MLITEDNSINLPITKPLFVDREDSKASFTMDNKYDGFGGSVFYDNHVQELSDMTKNRGL